ncbi:MAG: metal-dependent transcriptional regulator [Anaerolineae bacterium]
MRQDNKIDRNSTREHHIEEMLEAIWTLEEEGKRRATDIIHTSISSGGSDVLAELIRRELVTQENDQVFLTKQGQEQAEQTVRRHRLAERLLMEVLQLEEAHAEESACRFEHVLSPEVTDSVCTFLGHPPLCPHGKAIPRGPCCVRFQKEMRPLVMPLTDFELGREGRIVFVTAKYPTRLDRLAALGVIPGSTVRVHQRHPTYVIKVGETEIAIEGDIAGEIYVKST